MTKLQFNRTGTLILTKGDKYKIEAARVTFLVCNTLHPYDTYTCSFMTVPKCAPDNDYDLNNASIFRLGKSSGSLGSWVNGGVWRGVVKVVWG